MLQSTPGVLSVVSDQLCLVYHAETGQILHAHRVTTYEGGNIPVEADINRRAIENMQNLQRGEEPRILETQQVRTVFIQPEQLKPGVAYKVDVRTVQLEPLDRK